MEEALQESTEAVQEQPVQEEQVETAAQQASESVADKNFAELRKAKAVAERERDESNKKLQEILRQQGPPKKEVADPELGDDDLAEGRHLKKLRNDLNSYKKQVEQTTTEARIKAEYPDFESVVTAESIERLRVAYPEIAAKLSTPSSLYNTASSTYTLIKKLGIYEDKSYDASKEVVQKNMAKPRSLSSVSPQQGDSPLSHANAFANGLTPELKKKLYREMMDARRSS